MATEAPKDAAEDPLAGMREQLGVVAGLFVVAVSPEIDPELEPTGVVVPASSSSS